MNQNIPGMKTNFHRADCDLNVCLNVIGWYYLVLSPIVCHLSNSSGSCVGRNMMSGISGPFLDPNCLLIYHQIPCSLGFLSN